MTPQLVDIKGCAALLAVHRATVWRLMKKDPRFPKPVPLPIRGLHWSVDEIAAYVAALKAERDGRQAVA